MKYPTLTQIAEEDEVTVHTYKPDRIRATFTTEDGRVIEIAPITMIEPAEFITLEPQPPVRLSFTCTATITPPLIVGGKQWCELVYGPDRRVVGRKIRQARRRMRRMMEAL